MQTMAPRLLMALTARALGGGASAICCAALQVDGAQCVQYEMLTLIQGATAGVRLALRESRSSHSQLAAEARFDRCRWNERHWQPPGRSADETVVQRCELLLYYCLPEQSASLSGLRLLQCLDQKLLNFDAAPAN